MKTGSLEIVVGSWAGRDLPPSYMSAGHL